MVTQMNFLKSPVSHCRKQYAEMGTWGTKAPRVGLGLGTRSSEFGLASHQTKRLGTVGAENSEQKWDREKEDDCSAASSGKWVWRQ